MLRHYFQTSDRFLTAEETAGELHIAYRNPATGVYAVFEWCQERTPPVPLPNGLTDTGLSFYLNFLRPRFFALETMPILEELCQVLHACIVDPLRQPIEPERPDAAELVRRWTRHNEQAVREAGADPANPLWKPSLSPDHAEAWWRYSRERPALQERLGPEVYVPPMLLTYDPWHDVVRREVLWSEGMAQVFPECDYLRVLRHHNGDEEDPEEGCIRYDDALRHLKLLLRDLDEAIPRLKWLHPDDAPDAAYVLDRLPLDPAPLLPVLAAEDVVDVPR